MLSMLFYRHMAFQDHIHVTEACLQSLIIIIIIIITVTIIVIYATKIFYTFICGNTLDRFDTLNGRLSGI